MNILYPTISDLSDITKRGIYTDLIREFIANGHRVYILTPLERKHKKPTQVCKFPGCTIARLKTGNLFKTNLIEKGISNLLLEWQYKCAIKKYFGTVKFDLILYATPPVTLAGVIDFVKRRDRAQSYLMLKDIFPQNAVDIGLLKKTGIKGILYRSFKRKEKYLYAISDYIGCLSEANVRYLLKHNPDIHSERVEVSPNSVSPICLQNREIGNEGKLKLCSRYHIPTNKILFLYGGNFGIPQGVDFIVNALRACEKQTKAHFILCGAGTEFKKIQNYISTEKPTHVSLMNYLPKNEYDQLVSICNVGLIFLDHRFTIPNFPSRLLSYMENEKPVFAATDTNTDIGQVVIKGGFGWFCESNDAEKYSEVINHICLQSEQLPFLGKIARRYLEDNYTVSRQYQTIVCHFSH